VGRSKLKKDADRKGGPEGGRESKEGTATGAWLRNRNEKRGEDEERRGRQVTGNS